MDCLFAYFVLDWALQSVFPEKLLIGFLEANKCHNGCWNHLFIIQPGACLKRCGLWLLVWVVCALHLCLPSNSQWESTIKLPKLACKGHTLAFSVCRKKRLSVDRMVWMNPLSHGRPRKRGFWRSLQLQKSCPSQPVSSLLLTRKGVWQSLLWTLGNSRTVHNLPCQLCNFCWSYWSVFCVCVGGWGGGGIRKMNM